VVFHLTSNQHRDFQNTGTDDLKKQQKITEKITPENKTEDSKEIKCGDRVLIDLTLIDSDGNLIFTTNRNIAAKDGFDTEHLKKIHPIVVTAGGKDVIKPLSDLLCHMVVGGRRKFVLSPAQAYGEYNPSLVQIVNRSLLEEKGISPDRGQILSINGAKATITDINQTHVVLDFNHPLAGRTLVYNIHVLKKLSSHHDE